MTVSVDGQEENLLYHAATDRNGNFRLNAPVGDFHTSEFLHVWLAEAALAYHSGVTATVRQGGHYWEDRCPDVRGADLVVTPAEILDRASGERDSAPPNVRARRAPAAPDGRGR